MPATITAAVKKRMRKVMIDSLQARTPVHVVTKDTYSIIFEWAH